MMRPDWRRLERQLSQVPELPVPEIPASQERTRLGLPKVAFPAQAEFPEPQAAQESSSRATSSPGFPLVERLAVAQVVKVAQSRWALDQKQSARMQSNRGRRLAVFS